MQRKTLIAVCLCLLALVIFNIATLGHPPVWPDEAEYADVAHNIVQTGQPTSRLHQGFFQTDTWIYGYPPLLFLLLSVSFKLFGFSIFVMRFTSISAGVLCIILIFLIAHKILKDPRFALLTVFLLTVDMTFLRTARVGRPEIYILLFSVAAYVFLLYGKKQKYYIFASILGTLAGLVHPIGFIVIAILLLHEIVQNRSLSLQKTFIILVPPFVGLGLWIFASGLSVSGFVQSIQIAYSRKPFEPSYIEQLFMGGEVAYTFLYISLLIGSTFSMVYLLFNAIPYRAFLLIALLILWTGVIYGKSFWYFVYPLPFVYLSYAAIIKHELRKNVEDNFQLMFIFLVLVVTIVCNFKMNLSILKYIQGHSYTRFAHSIQKYIPNGSTVFISSIPDPYFELQKNKSLTIRQFPGLPSSRKKYLTILQKADYVIYNQQLDVGYGNTLREYLKKHTNKTYIIDNGPNEYKAVVIKIKK